jgi:hypothetical protein
MQHSHNQNSFTDEVTEIISATKNYPYKYKSKIKVSILCINKEDVRFDFSLLDFMDTNNFTTSFSGAGISYRFDNGAIKTAPPWEAYFRGLQAAITKTPVDNSKIDTVSLQISNQYRASESPTITELLESKQLRVSLPVVENAPITLAITLSELNKFFSVCPIIANRAAKFKDDMNKNTDYPEQLSQIIDPSDWSYIQKSMAAAYSLKGIVQWSNNQSGYSGKIIPVDGIGDFGCNKYKVTRSMGNNLQDMQTADVEYCSDGTFH